MPTILGLDLSISNTGICLLDDGKTVMWSNKTNPKPGKGKDDRYSFERIEDQLNFIIDKLNRYPIDWIILEGMSMAQYSQSREILAYLHGIVKRALYKMGFNIKIIPPSTLKKYVTGKGNADKNDMVEWVKREWTIDMSEFKKKDDVADAYSLARMGWDAFEYLLGVDIKQERLTMLQTNMMIKTAREIATNKGLDLSRSDKE